VVITLSFWAYRGIKGRKRADINQMENGNPQNGKPEKIIPTWVWLAVTIIVLTAVSDIFITRHNQQVTLANNVATLEAVASSPTALPPPATEENASGELSFAAPVAVNKLCFVPSKDIAKNIEDSYAWRSVQLAAAQYGAQANYINPDSSDDAGYTKIINQLIQENCDLIIGNYASQGQAIMKLAAGNPDQNFMLIGGGSDLPNVWVTKYSLPEQAYLAGYLAAAASRSGKVGTFGDPQIPNMVSSMNCFALGVQDYNKAQQANVTILGWDSERKQGLYLDDLKNTDQGITLANDLISQGADVVFPMVWLGEGSTGSGIIMTVDQHAGVYLIGVDLDWAWAMPEFAGAIISSMKTRYDQSIAIAVDAMARGEFKGGVHEGKLDSGEISLSPLIPKFSELVSPQVNDQMVNQSKPAVISAEISACEIHQTIGGFLNLNAVDGSDWPANALLTIRVFATPGGELIFTGSTLTDQNGSLFQQVNVDLVPGMDVEVNFGAEISSVTLVPLTVDVVDPVSDSLSGTAPAGAKINISLGDIGTDIKGYLSVTASGDGHWEASFSGNYDINSQTVVQATVPDTNGNGTIIKIQAK
jgi:basic membrane protein A